MSNPANHLLPMRTIGLAAVAMLAFAANSILGRTGACV